MNTKTKSYLLIFQWQGRGCCWLGPGLHQSVEAGQLGQKRLVAGDLGPDKDTRGRVVRPEADLALPMSMSARTQQHHSSTTAAPTAATTLERPSGHMLLVSTFPELLSFGSWRPPFLRLVEGRLYGLSISAPSQTRRSTYRLRLYDSDFNALIALLLFPEPWVLSILLWMSSECSLNALWPRKMKIALDKLEMNEWTDGDWHFLSSCRIRKFADAVQIRNKKLI